MIRYCLILGLGISAAISDASPLSESLTDDVNRTSVHLRCRLSEMENAEFASFSKITIKTEFGDDSPSVEAFDYKGHEVKGITLNDFTDHEKLSLRVFELGNPEDSTIVNLIVVYSKRAGRMSATAVLTGNGKDSPGVVRSADMNCTYVGPMAINN